MASSIVPLHSLGHDNQNEMQHYFWSWDTTGAGVGIIWNWHCNHQCHHCIHHIKEIKTRQHSGYLSYWRWVLFFWKSGIIATCVILNLPGTIDWWCTVSCLMEDSIGWYLDLSLLLYCESLCVYVQVCVIKYTLIVPSSRLYTWCLLAIVTIWCWVC